MPNPSSSTWLESLTLLGSDTDALFRFVPPTGCLSQNTNLRKLKTDFSLLEPTVAALQKNTTLVYLVIVGARDYQLHSLIDLLQLNHTIRELTIHYCVPANIDLVLLLVEAAASSRSMKKLRFGQRIYNELPSDVKQQYEHLLELMPVY